MLFHRYETDADGTARVQVFRSTSSAALSSLVWANGLAIVPEGETIAYDELIKRWSN